MGNEKWKVEHIEYAILSKILGDRASFGSSTVQSILDSVRGFGHNSTGKESIVKFDGSKEIILSPECEAYEFSSFGGCKIQTAESEILVEVVLNHGRLSWLQWSIPISKIHDWEVIACRCYDKEGCGEPLQRQVGIAPTVDCAGHEVLTGPPATDLQIADLCWRIGPGIADSVISMLRVSSYFQSFAYTFYGIHTIRSMDPEQNYFVLAATPGHDQEVDYIEFRQHEGLQFVNQITDESVGIGIDFKWGLQSLATITQI